jgi:hypothetical protein
MPLPGAPPMMGPGLPPPPGPGMAPPPTPGPRKTQGGGRNKKLIDAARLILEFIEEEPGSAKSLHPIVDRLTKEIRTLVAPTRPPGPRGMDLPDAPGLDQSPTSGSEDPGTPFQMISRMAGA